MCIKSRSLVYHYISARNFGNLPDFGWWYHCDCGLPTYNEDYVCNTCKRQARYS